MTEGKPDNRPNDDRDENERKPLRPTVAVRARYLAGKAWPSLAKLRLRDGTLVEDLIKP